MSCGCGKTRGSLQRPIIAGRPNGLQPVLLRTLMNVSGVRAGKEVYVTGDSVSMWIEQGLVEAV